MLEILAIGVLVLVAVLADLLLLGETGVVAFVLSLFQARARDHAGADALVGEEAIVQRAFAPDPTGAAGVVRIRGELWKAVLEAGDELPGPGEAVVITKVSGLVLTVRPREGARSTASRGGSA